MWCVLGLPWDAHNRWALSPSNMNHFTVCRWLSRLSNSRQIGVALLFGTLAGSSLATASAQEAFKQPDYSKFPVESGPITLEVWSWVSGLDKAAKLFEEAYPNIKVHVNNVGGGPGRVPESADRDQSRLRRT